MRLIIDVIKGKQNKELYRLLCDQKDSIDINKLDSKGKALLHYAAEFGNVEIVQMILNFQGASQDLKTATGKTALSISTNPSIKRALMKKPPQKRVNSRNENLKVKSHKSSQE